MKKEEFPDLDSQPKKEAVKPKKENKKEEEPAEPAEQEPVEEKKRPTFNFKKVLPSHQDDHHIDMDIEKQEEKMKQMAAMEDKRLNERLR